MKVNQAAIYGTTASPFQKLPWGRCTKKVQGRTTTLYLHVFDWPSDGRLVVPGLMSSVSKAYLLADKKHAALTTSSSGEGLVISLPAHASDALSSTVVVKLRSELQVE